MTKVTQGQLALVLRDEYESRLESTGRTRREDNIDTSPTLVVAEDELSPIRQIDRRARQVDFDEKTIFFLLVWVGSATLNERNDLQNSKILRVLQEVIKKGGDLR